MSFIGDLVNKVRNNPRVTAASVTGAVAGVLMWVLATFGFHGSVPLEIQTAVPVVAAYVAGIVVPHDPEGSKEKEDGKEAESK